MARRSDMGGDTRIVVSDDNRRLWLTVYAQDGEEPLAVVELTPQRAIRLAGELIDVSARHLDRRIGVIR